MPKVRAESNGELTPAQGLSDEEGKQMILGPISLGGQKKGDLFQIEVESFWKWEWNANNANKFTIRNVFKISKRLFSLSRLHCQKLKSREGDSDVGDRIIMLATFFVMLVIFPIYQIGHQHFKRVTNTFGLQYPSPISM